MLLLYDCVLALAAVIAGPVPAPYMIAIATPFGITQGTMANVKKLRGGSYDFGSFSCLHN